jgi:hypothetical protein
VYFTWVALLLVLPVRGLIKAFPDGTTKVSKLSPHWWAQAM